MIRTEFYITREDGVELVRAYSDAGYKIRQVETGAIYDDAVYPSIIVQTFVETDEPIEDEEITDAEALNILLGRVADVPIGNE